MLAIRLFRVGKKNQPAFKIVVTDKTRPTRAGRFLEILGFYNTLTKKRDFKVDRVKYWISVGAKPSDTVHNLLVSEKIISGNKIPSHNKAPKEADKSAPTGQVEKSIEVAPVEQVAPVAETPVEQPKEEVPVVEEKPVEEQKTEETPVEIPQPETLVEENK